jgi:hypothetical protein
MIPFPEQYELIALFESEPVLTDAKVPWTYNHLRFTRAIGDNTVDCAIEPGSETLRFRWLQHGAEVLDLDLRGVSGVTVECESGREALVAHFRKDRGVWPVRIQFTPAIHVSWGTTQELY